MAYNVYCDESCHLEKDNSDVKVLGAVSCPTEEKATIYEDIRKIKIRNGFDIDYQNYKKQAST